MPSKISQGIAAIHTAKKQYAEVANEYDKVKEKAIVAKDKYNEFRAEVDQARGILNATVTSGTTDRFEGEAEKRLTSTHLRRGSRGRVAGSRIQRTGTRDEDGAIVGRNDGQGMSQRLREAFAGGGEMYEEGDESLVIDETRSLKAPPDHPSFPFIILGLALLKDSLDILALTGILWVIMFPFTLAISITIMIWTISRLQMEYMHKHRMRKYAIRGVALLLEQIPGVGVLPLATVFVLLTHFDDTKMVKFIWFVVEQVQRTERTAR